MIDKRCNTMGEIVQAICKCGYESEKLFLGTGFVARVNKIPVYCPACMEVSRAYMKEPYLCFICHAETVPMGYVVKSESPSIDEPHVFNICLERIEKPGPEKVKRKDRHKRYADWITYVIGRYNHVCPRCFKEEMEFEIIGCWD